MFIYLPSFEKQFKSTGLNRDDEIALEQAILDNPTIGAVIKGTGGIRKFRIALPNTGKSGGARVVYVDFPKYGRVYLIALFAKSVKENLSKEERNELKQLSKMLENEAERGIKS
jgi:hypothetical protein